MKKGVLKEKKFRSLGKFILVYFSIKRSVFLYLRTREYVIEEESIFRTLRFFNKLINNKTTNKNLARYERSRGGRRTIRHDSLIFSACYVTSMDFKVVAAWRPHRFGSRLHLSFLRNER